jgi:hypothetical protein
MSQAYLTQTITVPASANTVTGGPWILFAARRLIGATLRIPFNGQNGGSGAYAAFQIAMTHAAYAAFPPADTFGGVAYPQTIGGTSCNIVAQVTLPGVADSLVHVAASQLIANWVRVCFVSGTVAPAGGTVTIYTAID